MYDTSRKGSYDKVDVKRSIVKLNINNNDNKNSKNNSNKEEEKNKE